MTTRFELPGSTIAKVILTLAAIWLLLRLWPLLVQLVVAFLLAAALDPLVTRLERRGWPRSGSVAAITTGFLGVVALVLWLLIPPLIEQGTNFADDLPAYTDRVQGLLDRYPAVQERIESASTEGSADPTAVFTGALAFGSGLVQSVATFFIVLVLTVYLLVDGERVYGWVTHYLPPRQRAKVRLAMPEISKVVSGYIVGQVITSLIFGVFAFVVLAVLGVPEPLLLAIVAAFADAIPIAGVLIATIPAVLLGFTVSIPTAAIVFALYMGYQQIENYVLVPRIYRGTLQISSFAVLVAVLIGGQLLGIIGVLLALPIAAAIPVVERIWRDQAAPVGSMADSPGQFTISVPQQEAPLPRNRKPRTGDRARSPHDPPA
ncbi:MAG: AI-2E family transporter [Chloroflexota bacterium]|nr:AI-2E family transporter [Chloroflexota bacterium]